MVEFSSGYYHPMDRDSGHSTTADNSTSDVGVGVKDIGMSIPLGIAAPNVQGVAAKIRTGARKFELAFPGAGRAQRGTQTPGIYGKLQRQALEELGRSSNVDFTTHASYGVMGLAGMDQQGNFSKQNKKFAVDEIKRAVEFAADVARGGNVVVHTGEFQRPVSEESWAFDPATGRRIFQSYGEEPEKAIIRVVDDRTGQVVTQVRKDQRVARPIWHTSESDYQGTDQDGNPRFIKKGEYIDYEGRWMPPEQRIPDYDYDKGTFKVHYLEWDDFVNESQKFTVRAKEFWKEHPDPDDPAWQAVPWWRFKDAKSEDEILVRPEEAYVLATLETNAANSRGWAYYYGHGFDQDVDRLNKLKKSLSVFEKLEAATPEEEKWKLIKTSPFGDELTRMGLLPEEGKLPTIKIKEAIRSTEQKMKQGHEASTSQWAQAKDAEETMRHVKSSHTYALGESFGAYAEAGISAMEQSNKLEKQGKLKEPIFVAMENIFQESYGSHPDEMITLVEGAREQMADMLVKQRGYTQQQAQREAEDHIKGHLDTGHLNIWRKFWVADTKKSPEQNDADFNKWLLKETERLAKKNIIGSVHLADNYGYQDDHLSPGEGNCPVKEMVLILRKHGYKGQLIVEPGADATTDLSDFHGLMKTWRLFGSSIYGVGLGGGTAPSRDRAWGQVQYSYFGRMEPPYFVFGKYSPSEDWTLWSGVPME
ncbi:MAG: sugar phosphate isomerase/epimerase [Nanoarchaeota archaeon]|nr:sugar phosphate isomerase/epimerase [Nanoarchaeota archaeon]